MTQTAIPYIFMRGGSSRGAYFKRSDLPEDTDILSDVLVAALGSGHRLNINGIGGGDAVTTKVAMLSCAQDEWADIDYFFAQVSVETKQVDYAPTCGNILSGVGAAAIEMGLIKASEGKQTIKINAVNTGARVITKVLCRAGKVVYDGDTVIAGVPDSAAPVTLSFLDVAGAVTGSMLPTGRVRDTIDGIEVTCLDVAMPVVIARATDFGITGHEDVSTLNNNTELFSKIENIRLAAGKRMGMGDVGASVTPKFALIASARHGGHLAARYFMPWKTHPAMAVTGAQCLAACGLMHGSVADGICLPTEQSPCTFVLEHPSGNIQILMDFQYSSGQLQLDSAGLVRTARKLADGHVYIPRSIWSGQHTEETE